MNVRACGAIAILAAAVLAWFAASAWIQVDEIHSRNANAGWVKEVGDRVGISDAKHNEARDMDTLGRQYAVGAVILGIAGLTLMMRKGREAIRVNPEGSQR